eukprot:2075901-Lingulodinium_polyedra.AAC.1
MRATLLCKSTATIQEKLAPITFEAQLIESKALPLFESVNEVLLGPWRAARHQLNQYLGVAKPGDPDAIMDTLAKKADC